MAKTWSLQTPWLPFGPPRSEAQLRVFTFPYAGGGASLYRRWVDLAPRWMDICPVQLPGRERRMSETPQADAGPLLDSLVQALEPYLDAPFALFGHSLGGYLAFALSQRMEKQKALATLIAISACPAPSEVASSPDYRSMSDDQLTAFTLSLGGTPQDMLHHPEMRALVLPRLRADMALRESLKNGITGTIQSPILAFAGAADAVAPPASLEGWRARTQSVFDLKVMAGDHFFLTSVGAAQTIIGGLADAVATNAKSDCTAW